jgi:hypothetical protein
VDSILSHTKILRGTEKKLNHNVNKDLKTLVRRYFTADDCRDI